MHVHVYLYAKLLAPDKSGFKQAHGLTVRSFRAVMADVALIDNAIFASKSPPRTTRACSLDTPPKKRRLSKTDLHSVIATVSRYLESSNLHGDYMIAGSYAAYIKAKEMGIKIDLAYNDIDIFIRRPERPSNPLDYLLRKWKLDLDDLSVEIHIVELREDWALQKLVEYFDINAIRIGVQINHTCPGQPICPSEKDWEVCRSFMDFLETRQLKIVDLSKMIFPQSCLVRLLQKASQMSFAYEFPSTSELDEYVHEKAMCEVTYKKLYKKLITLPTKWQDEFFLHFKLVQLSPCGSVPFWQLQHLM